MRIRRRTIVLYFVACLQFSVHAKIIPDNLSEMSDGTNFLKVYNLPKKFNNGNELLDTFSVVGKIQVQIGL